ncbi:hypothetical protein AK812_SmicGene44801, partial [Symbiodinium microadriaticum]
MAKKIMKVKNPPPFPAPKRGKARTLRKPASILKKPASSMKKFTKIPYVRHGNVTTKTRNERVQWGISVQMILKKNTLSLIKFLQKDHILPKMTTCPHCGGKNLSSLQYSSLKRVYTYRCNHKNCMKRVQPHSFHPIFIQGNGNSLTSLAIQAAILFCAVIGLTTVQTHLLLNANKKIISTIYGNLEISRTRYVLMKEKDIVYGEWKDVEADEVDLGKGLVDAPVCPGMSIRWEQWGGLVERGRPSSLRLFRLSPKLTGPRAPGPGPISKHDWKPIAEKYLAGKGVILHTDGARAYKMKIPNVIHCNVVHQKKKKIVNGKAIWEKPHYTKLYNIRLPNGKKLTVKSGTQ